MTVTLKDGTVLPEILVEYPIGHKRRRTEGFPVLVSKFKTNIARRFPQKQQEAILKIALDQKALEAMSVCDFMDMFVI
jgi:2-methylcitrate dehydratase